MIVALLAWLDRVFGRMSRMERKLDLVLENTREIIMDYTQLIAAMDKETNDIAARLDALTSQIKGAPTAEQAAALQAISDRLRALSSDPSAPIPPTP